MIKEISITWLKPKKRKWYHLHDLPRFRLNESVTLNGYTVPEGYITNGGDIPGPMRGIMNPLSRGFPAYICHDHRCSEKTTSRKEANNFMKRDLKTCEYSPRLSWAATAGVRMYAAVMGIK